MFEGTNDSLSCGCQKIGKGRIPVKFRPKDHWIDQISNLMRKQHPIFSKQRRRTHQNIILPCVPVEQDLKGCQEGHVRCDAVVSGKFFKAG